MVYIAYAKSKDGATGFTKVAPKENLYHSGYINPTLTPEETGFSTGIGGWGTTAIPNEQLLKMLKPNTTYAVTYTFELLSNTPNTSVANNSNGALILYSGITGYVTNQLWVDHDAISASSASNWVVGTKVTSTKVFKTPVNFCDLNANYRILFYTRRMAKTDGSIVLESGRFLNIKFEELADGETGGTAYTSNPRDSFIKSYMPYTGTAQTDSSNYKDYTWRPTLQEGLTHTIHPENATNKAVTYTVGNSNVATITANSDNTGVLVTPNNLGGTVVTVSTEDSGKTATATVNSDRTLTLDTSLRIPQASLGYTHRVLSDIRDTKAVNLITGSASLSNNFLFASNNSLEYPITSTVVADHGFSYQRITRARNESGTWGKNVISLYQVGVSQSTFGTEPYLGTGYWASFYIRSNYAIQLGNSGMRYVEFDGTTVYNSGELKAVVSLVPDEWQLVKLWVPPLADSVTNSTRGRFLIVTPDLSDTVLENIYLDCSRTMVSREEPFFWSPAPEDIGVPHGQPNLLDGTSSSWVEKTFSGWVSNSKDILLTTLGVSAGETVSLSTEIDATQATVSVCSCISTINKSGGATVYLGNYISAGESGISTVEVPIASDGSISALRVMELRKIDSTTSVTVRFRNQKLIKGSKALMDAWAPSFADFSAGKYAFNPYYEIPTELYKELPTPTNTTGGTTFRTKIVGNTCEVRVVFDTVNAVKELFPAEFTGLTTDTDILNRFSAITKSIETHIPYKGSAPTRYYANRGLISRAGSYILNNTTVNVDNFDTRTVLLSPPTTPYIQTDMTTIFFVRTDGSDGVTASSVTIGNPTQTIVVQPTAKAGAVQTITITPK